MSSLCSRIYQRSIISIRLILYEVKNMFCENCGEVVAICSINCQGCKLPWWNRPDNRQTEWWKEKTSPKKNII